MSGDNEFEDLCFEFGIELEDVVSMSHSLLTHHSLHTHLDDEK